MTRPSSSSTTRTASRRWRWLPAEGPVARTTSRRQATSRCRRSWTPRASCTRPCCPPSAWAWPHSQSEGRASHFYLRSCSTCCAGAAPCRPPGPRASWASARRETRARPSRTSSSKGASCGTSRTATPTSTRKSSRTSSTAGSWRRRTGRARSTARWWNRRRRGLHLAAAAPVHDQHLTVHVASGVRGQEQDRGCDLVRDADAAHRVLREHSVEDLLVAPQRLGETRLDQARGHGVDPYLAAQLACQLAGQHDHTGL